MFGGSSTGTIVNAEDIDLLRGIPFGITSMVMCPWMAVNQMGR